MDDKHCDMCTFFDPLNEYCSRYREIHYPDDGEGCPGWEYWKDGEQKCSGQNASSES